VAEADPWLIALDTLTVLRSGAHTQLEALFKGRPGPKRSISWLGFLVVLRLAARRQIFHIQNMAKLYLRLPPEVHRRFGMPGKASRKKSAQRTVADKVLDDFQEMWLALCHALDSSPVTRPYLTPERRRSVYEQRVALFDAIASGWLPQVPHDAHVQDGTAIDAFRNMRVRGDPHARVGHRTATYREVRIYVYGYVLVCLEPAAVDVRPEPAYLVVQHELTPANEPEGRTTLRLYRRHTAICALGHVIGDRQVSHTPRDFGVQIAMLGGLPVHDLHEDLQGPKGVLDHFWIIDSWLWHGDLPAEYWRLTYNQDHQDAGEYRSHFAAQLLNGPAVRDGLLSVRVGCPGRDYDAAHRATVICPGSDGQSPNLPHVTSCTESALCRASAGVWLPLHEADGEPTPIGRAYQSLPRLSPRWWDIYRPPRAHVENSFVTITTPDGANLADRAHRVSGLPGTGLWAANGLAIHNHQRLWTWWNDEDVQAALSPQDRLRLRRDVLLADRASLTRLHRRLFPG
jgi:hypothetical protein